MNASRLFIDMILESKWKKMLAAGKLGKDSLRKIQKAGLPKSKKDYFEGIEKGTKNILKKQGAKETNVLHQVKAKMTGMKPGDKVKNPLSSHSIVTPRKARIHVPAAKDVASNQRELAKVVKRHEADEIVAINKQFKKLKRPGSPMFGATAGPGHASDTVLKNERKITNTANALYGKTKGGRGIINKARKKTGEYKKVDKLSKKDVKKHDKKLIKDKLKLYKSDKPRDYKNMDGEVKTIYKDIAKTTHKLKGTPRSERKRELKKFRESATPQEYILRYIEGLNK